MFGLGAMEIGVIVVMAVLLFPAKELPKLVRTIARFYGQIRKTAEDFRSSVLDDEDLREPIDEIRGAYNEARWEVRDAERKARQELAKAQMEMRMATAKRIQAERDAEKAKQAQLAAEHGGDDGGDGDGADASTEGRAGAPALGGASAASPVRIAANDDQNDDHPGGDESRPLPSGPVAGSDPRQIAARLPPTYTPPNAETPEPGDHDDGSREGVA